MNKYYVLSTNSDLIEIEADDYLWGDESGCVGFYKRGMHGNEIVGMFQLSNIVGVYNITEENK